MRRIGTTLGAALLLASLAAFVLPRQAAAQADPNDKLSFESLTARPSGGYGGGGGYAPRHSYARHVYARHGYARHMRAAAWHGRGYGRHTAMVRRAWAGGRSTHRFAGARFSRVHYVSRTSAAHHARRR